MLKVFEVGFVLWDQSLQKPEHIAFDVRVCVLVDSQRACGVLGKQVANTFGLAVLRDEPLNFARYIYQFFAV